MNTALFSHSACLYHDTGVGHPECGDRLRAVLHALEAEDFFLLDRREAPRATREQLERVHTPAYLDHLFSVIPEDCLHHLDGDTVIGPDSGEAALRAAGAVCAAIDAVMAGEARNAFCAVRPPGHHAEADKAMGFCLLNNVAVGARHAQAAHGLARVAVVDFDVHHGNGTEAMFAEDPGLFYASVHQWPLYPGTGRPGQSPNLVNIGLRAGAGSEAFRHAVDAMLLPSLEAFAPDLILISAGFDGHAGDPLAELCLTDDDYGWVTGRLAAMAGHCAGGRLVSTLEGGYNLRALAGSAVAHVRSLMFA